MGKDPKSNFGDVTLEMFIKNPRRIVEWFGGDASLYFGKGFNEQPSVKLLACA